MNKVISFTNLFQQKNKIWIFTKVLQLKIIIKFNKVRLEKVIFLQIKKKYQALRFCL